MPRIGEKLVSDLTWQEELGIEPVGGYPDVGKLNDLQLLNGLIAKFIKIQGLTLLSSTNNIPSLHFQDKNLASVPPRQLAGIFRLNFCYLENLRNIHLFVYARAIRIKWRELRLKKLQKSQNQR